MPDKEIRNQYEAALKEERAAHAKLQKLTAQTSVRTPPNLLGQTARELGVTIPAELLKRADRVIE